MCDRLVAWLLCPLCGAVCTLAVCLVKRLCCLCLRCIDCALGQQTNDGVSTNPPLIISTALILALHYSYGDTASVMEDVPRILRDTCHMNASAVPTMARDGQHDSSADPHGRQ